MGRICQALLLSAALGSCHSLAKREHRRGPPLESQESAGAESVETPSSSGAGSVSSEGASAGADTGGAGQGSGSGGDAGSGARNESQPCDAGAPCHPAKSCWSGLLECVDGEPVCASTEPLSARTPCGDGYECTGDGVCIKAIPSCAASDTPGCRVVTIEGGTFKMGWRAVDPSTFVGELVELPTFAIDAYEISVARFRVFWNDGHPTAPPLRYPSGQLVTAAAAPIEPATTLEDPAYNWSEAPGDREAHPINRVYWETAFAFCAWDGGRLATEAEWEYVATGRSGPGLEPGRTYPWGEATPTCDLAHTWDCGVHRTVRVDALSGYGGVFQMAGNVSEWTADHYEPYGAVCWPGTTHESPLCYEHGGGPWTLKGGSFTGSTGQLPGVWRMGSSALSGARGIRCARDIVSN